MTHSLRPVLLGFLAGMLVGGSGVAALSIPVLQDHTAEMQTMSAAIRGMTVEQHRIRRDFNMGMKMADDVRPGQGVRSGQAIGPPSVSHLDHSEKQPRR